MRPIDPDDVKVYLYTGDDMKSKWKKGAGCYRLDIDKDFLSNKDNNIYLLDNNRSFVIGEILDSLDGNYDYEKVSAISDTDFYFRMWQKKEVLPPLDYLRFLNDTSELLDLITTGKIIFMLCAIVVQNQQDDSSLNIDWTFVSLKYSYCELEEDIEFVQGPKYRSNIDAFYRNTWVEEMLNENRQLLGYHLHIGDKEEYVDAYVLRSGDFGVNYVK